MLWKSINPITESIDNNEMFPIPLAILQPYWNMLPNCQMEPTDTIIMIMF